MNLMFWKKQAPGDTAKEDADDKTVAIPREAAPTEENSNAEAAEKQPVAITVRNMKKRMIIGAVLGTLILLLVGIGFAGWKFLAPDKTEKQTPPNTTAHETTVDEGMHMHSAPQAETSPQDEAFKREAEMQARIDALKQQNEQMQSQLDELKKSGQDAPPATASADRGSSAPVSGDVLLFSGKNTKESAEALKQAIESMNESSSTRKPRKSAP